MRVVKITLLMGLLLSSCLSNEVLYYGKSYPVTNDIDIYFQQSDIKEPYEIVGKSIYEDSSISSSDRIQEKIIKAMKLKGVDGLIFEDISIVNYIPSKISADATVTSVNSDRVQVIKTTLVKYKRNIVN